MKNNICILCPNNCKVDRSVTLGACKSSNAIKIAKYYPHKFEEPILSGEKGSGTIFFCGCSLGCVFCQNYKPSRSLTGKEITPRELTVIFKELEDMGVHNINLVTPTHYAKNLVEAFEIYKPQIPVVYNTHSYETVETLKLIDKYVDVYLPDLKYFSPNLSKRYTGKENYFEYASKAIKFMLSSKKRVFGKDGMLIQGVIVRHLILPLGVNDSKKLLKWYSQNKSSDSYLSLMAQYTPFGNVENFPELNRKITQGEYDRVYEYMLDLGIEDYFIQEKESAKESFIPKWDF